MSEYITDAEIDEMVRRLEAHVAVDIRTALRDAVLWGARYAEVRQQSKSGGSVCEWTPYYEEDDPATAGYMQSGCHDEHGRAHEWMDGEGDPPGRWMKFCPFCGGKTAFVAQKSEPLKPNCDHPVVRQTITDVHELRIDTETRCTECGELLKSHSSAGGEKSPKISSNTPEGPKRG